MSHPLLSLLLVATLALFACCIARGVEAKGSILTCAYPQSFVPLAVYSASSGFDQRHQKQRLINFNDNEIPETLGLPGININAHARLLTNQSQSQYQQQQKQQQQQRRYMCYSSDVDGAYDLFVKDYSSASPSAAPIKIARAGISFNDHCRFSHDGRSVAFVSTRDKNPIGNQGWAAVFVIPDILSCIQQGGVASGDDNRSGDDGACTAVRLTPANATDFSPNWSPDDSSIAVASGSGAPGGAQIVMMRLAAGRAKTVHRETVAPIGGWPTWKSDTELLFHRPGKTVRGPWSIFQASQSPSSSSWSISMFMDNALTPFVYHHHPRVQTKQRFMAFATFDQTFRQIRVMDLESGQVTIITRAPTHHYNPTISLDADQRHFTVLFHRCRGGQQFPLVRKRRSPSSFQLHDTYFVAGDFPAMSPDGNYINNVGIVNNKGNQFSNINVLTNNATTAAPLFQGAAWVISYEKKSNNNSSSSSASSSSSSAAPRIAFSWGPAFAAANDSSVQIAIMNFDGSNVSLVTNTSGANSGYPAFIGSDWILFRTSSPCTAPGELEISPPFPSGHYKGPYHLAKRRADGTGPIVTVTCDTAKAKSRNGGGNSSSIFWIGDHHPHVADDGKTVVFASDRGHAQRLSIWTLNLDDLAAPPQEVFDFAATSVHPSSFFDSNGDLNIVFSSTYAGYSQEEAAAPFGFVFDAELFSLNLETGELTRLTHDFGENANAFVSPHALPVQALSSASGPELDCDFRDMINPIPPFLHKKTKTNNRKEAHIREAGGSGLLLMTAHGRLREALPGVDTHFSSCSQKHNNNSSTSNSSSGNSPAEPPRMKPRPFPHGHVKMLDGEDEEDDDALVETAEQMQARAKRAGCPYFQNRN